MIIKEWLERDKELLFWLFSPTKRWKDCVAAIVATFTLILIQFPELRYELFIGILQVLSGQD
jgi:hypothetical protein